MPAPDAVVAETFEVAPERGDAPDTISAVRRIRTGLEPGSAVSVSGAADDATVARWCELTGLVEAAGSTVGARVLTHRVVNDEPEPLVSIVVPAYRATFLDRVLDSVRDQTYERIEVLIGDDCPDDSVRDHLRRRDDLDFRYLGRPEERGGFIGNSRMLLREATGSQIKFLNDDDWLSPHCVERLTSCLVAHPGATLAGGRRDLVGADDELIENGFVVPDIAGRLGDDFVAEGDRALTDILARSLNWPGEPTPIQFRRADLVGADPFCIDGRPARRQGDLAMWIRLLARGDIIHLAEVVSTIRYHPDQERRHAGYADLVESEMAEQRRDAIRMGVLRPELHELRPRPLLPRPWWGPTASGAIGSGDPRPGWDRVQLASLSEPDDPWLAMASADHLAAADRALDAARVLGRVLERDPQRTDAAKAMLAIAEAIGAPVARTEMIKHVRLVTPYEPGSRDALLGTGLSDPHEAYHPLFERLDPDYVVRLVERLTMPAPASPALTKPS